MSAVKNMLWDAAKRVELKMARLQGKGYSTSIAHEVDLVYGVLDARPRLAMDIGGNKGDYTSCLLDKTPDLEIHVFEPAATNIAKLQARFGMRSNIMIVPSAVSCATGGSTLFSDESGSGMGSLTKRKLDHFNIAFECQEKISTLKFEDYWVDKLNSRSIDIVKIDVEGHELDVLESFGKAIEAVKVIQFEFGGTCIDTKVHFQDFWYFFKNKGFDLSRISPLGLCPIESYHERDEHFMFANFIAVRR